jgi:hypothetical protein
MNIHKNFQNSRNYSLQKVKVQERNENTLRSKRRTRTSRRRKSEYLRRRFSRIFREIEETVKKFYGPGSLFIGVRVVVSRNRVDSTDASFPRDACPLRRSEGDVFYQGSKVVVETDRRSQPASPRG